MTNYFTKFGYLLLVTFALLITVALCTSCTDQYSGPRGFAGANGKDGKDGSKGDKGDKGNTGSQGPAGSDATIPAIQLCKGCEAEYPNVFPEVGLCLDKKLYGVYSQNGGFLVELTDGVYKSHGINCECAFQVSGCEVKPL